MEESEQITTIDLKYFKILNRIILFDISFRSHWENKEWSKGAKNFCKDHEKSLCTIWYFSFHSRWRWEGITDKESIQECIAFIKILMKSITEWHEDYEEISNDQEFSEELRNYYEISLSLNENVSN